MITGCSIRFHCVVPYAVFSSEQVTNVKDYNQKENEENKYAVLFYKFC